MKSHLFFHLLLIIMNDLILDGGGTIESEELQTG